MKINQQTIVIGAGIAGLVAAYELQKAGIKVIILESSHKSGGRMVTENINNSIIDTGARFLSSGYPIISSLIKELTIEPDFVSTSPYCSVEKNGRIHTFRYNSPFSLLFSRLLGFGEWLRLGINGTKLYNATKALPVNNYSAWHQFDNQNCFEWSCDYYGKKITEYIIEPMLEAFYFQKTSETSKALSIALNTFGHNKSKTMTLAEGIAMLPARLSDKIKIMVQFTGRKGSSRPSIRHCQNI
jgi:oxygen-dependent protoporphyrinogen oxidase